MSDKRYFIWLAQSLGEGAPIKEILDDFKSPKNLYESNILQWRMSPSLTSRQIIRLKETPLTVADEIIYNCERNGYKIITYDDEKYPNRLKEIPNPPSVLYVDGELPDVDNNVLIGIVGTRKASQYAVKTAHIMARGITECGAIVVSGGALGVDSAAHKGALMAQGKTIAVLGCGLGAKYLSVNKSLRDLIKTNGALVTEYPPFTQASKFTFPMRNRIISGLSLGVLVVEAGIRSGSLITSNYAVEQGRDVYAIPGSVLSDEYAGTNKLIDDGAFVVTKPVHLIEQYKERFSSINIDKMRTAKEIMNDEKDISANVEKNEDKLSFDRIEEEREKRLKNESASMTLSGNDKIVFDSLLENYQHIDEISAKCNLKSFEVLSALTTLELMELAESASGKRYKLS